jgi:capsular polysaccharide transport system ATP-binding protein
MIELLNVSKYYPVKAGVKHILKDVSLTIPDSTNLAVLGPNGAGKSTLLRLIGGAEAPNKGRIRSNRSISWPLGIGSGFQSSLTGLQNVLFVCRINGLTPDQTRQVIEEVMEFTELGDYFNLPVKSYSSGMRARLSFGLSMAFLFDVYLIDELTSVGDAIFRAKAKQAFSNLRHRASIIFVSHNLQTLRESCDSALFLHDGTAAFFPNIEDGIGAYQEYIRSDRLTHAKELRDLEEANRLKRRRRRQRQLRRELAEQAKSTDSEDN